MLAITSPLPQFFDLNGSPLDNGSIYFGVVNQNPETSPVTVYWDAAGTQPAAQPIKTLNGYSSRSGTAAQVYTSGSFSMTVRDKQGRLVLAVADSGVSSNSQSLANQIAALDASLRDTTDAAKNAGQIGYEQSLVYAAGTVGNKLRADKSLLDFSGATADLKFAAAKASGTKWLRIPQGDHTITGWSVAESDSLVGLIFEPGARLLVAPAFQRIGLDIQKHYFSMRGTCIIESAGDSMDGLQTVGIRHGHPTLGGRAYCNFEAIRYAGFSSRGFVSYQAVYLSIGDIIGTGATGSPMYGVSIEPATIAGSGVVPPTTVRIGGAYISGALRGINIDRAGWIDIEMAIVEYCGSSTTTDGGMHFNNVTSCIVRSRYGEQNARNIVRVDSTPVFLGGSMFAATAADVVTYSGMAFDQRGIVQIGGNTINARKIGPDVNDSSDLTIGTNLTVPFAGGSVVFGNETMSVQTGTLTSATWTTVATIPADEMTGTSEQKAAYEYACYAGIADKSTGFDFGTVFNGVLRSYSGSVPAWLRISGNLIQMNVTNTTYGLNFKIVLRRVFPG